MARTRIELHPAAVDEARAAYEWYAERNPEYAVGRRRYLLRRFPYLVVYRTFDAAIQIIAIAHGRRRPGYWQERVT